MVSARASLESFPSYSATSFCHSRVSAEARPRRTAASSSTTSGCSTSSTIAFQSLASTSSTLRCACSHFPKPIGIARRNYTLTLVSATILQRWLELHELEEEARASLVVDRHLFWDALFAMQLPDVPESSLAHYYGDRSRRFRLLTLEEAELAWLAGLCHRNPLLQAVANSVRHADRDNIDLSKMQSPALVRRFHAELRMEHATVESVAASTGLQPRGVRYLLEAEPFEPLGKREAGRLGFDNLERLRSELGLPP